MRATHILVVQSGWVFVGTMKRNESLVTLSAAACIRKWGTSHGLGELALSGPLEETVLDPCGTVEVPLHAVLFWIPVKSEKWS